MRLFQPCGWVAEQRGADLIGGVGAPFAFLGNLPIGRILFGRVAQKCLVAATGLVDVGLARDLPGGVHGEHGHARVDDVHAVLRGDVGDGSAVGVHVVCNVTNVGPGTDCAWN